MKAIVIGSGPSGLMAALSLAKENHDVVVIDKNAKIGEKLLMSGNGKCNYTRAIPPHEFLENVISNKSFLKKAIYSFSPFKTIEFFENIGLESVIEEDKRVFPKSYKSVDVVNALVSELKKYSVKFLLNSEVLKTYKEDDKFVVELAHNALICDKLVLACGGRSYSSLSGGYLLAKSFNHTIVPLRPALSKMYVSNKFMSVLDGFKYDYVALKVKSIEGKKQLFGPISFEKDSISGHVVRNMSSFVNRQTIKEVTIDFKPKTSDEELNELLLQKFKVNTNKEIGKTLTPFVPHVLVSIILKQLNIAPQTLNNAITRDNRFSLIKYMKNFPLRFVKFESLDSALVTSGGIDVNEIDSKTMMSRLVPNLFLVGEMVDVDALIGGFSIQLALSMGSLVK